MGRVKGRVRSTKNQPKERLSKEATVASIRNVLEQHKYEGIQGHSWDTEEGYYHSCSCSWQGSYRGMDAHGRWMHDEHVANVFTQLGFRKLSMVEIMDLTEPERMNAARTTVQNRGAAAREQMKLQAQIDGLTALNEDLFSSYDGPLMCLDKCGNPKCRDDIRIGAIEDVSNWVKTRIAGLEEQLAAAKAKEKEE